MVRKLLPAAIAAFMSASALATYNANGSFVITGVLTYPESDTIYLQVSAPPTHPVCSNAFFALGGSIPAERRKIIMARVLLAKATGEVVNIGYDATGGCIDGGYIQVHRVG